MQRFLGLRGRNVNELPSLLSQVRFFRDSSPRTASFSPLSSIGNQNPYNSSYPKDPMIPKAPVERMPYERILCVRRVSNPSAKGKNVKFDAWAIVGDMNGSAAFCSGQSPHSYKAVELALRRARQSIRYYDLYERRTLYHDIDVNFSTMQIKLYSKPPGYSVRAQTVIYNICQALGIQDLAARIDQGNINPIKIARAFFYALEYKHKTPNDVARSRGRLITNLEHSTKKIY
jgi:ribosomal protein S5